MDKMLIAVNIDPPKRESETRLAHRSRVPTDITVSLCKL
jgi:hypothetical protein